MLKIVAEFLAASEWCVKGITFDAHGAHTYFKEALLGDFQTLDREVLNSLPFFDQVSYESLPRHVLPRLPARVCKHRGESIWALPGSCHASKASLGQQVSPLRNIHYGKSCSDHAMALSLGAPPCAFARVEAQSDFLTAMMYNPWFLVSNPETSTI